MDNLDFFFLFQPLTQFEVTLYNFTFFNISLLSFTIESFFLDPFQFWGDFMRVIFMVIDLNLQHQYAMVFYKTFVNTLYYKNHDLAIMYIKLFMFITFEDCMPSSNAIYDEKIIYEESEEVDFFDLFFISGFFLFLSFLVFVIKIYIDAIAFKLELLYRFITGRYDSIYTIHASNENLINLVDFSITRFHIATLFSVLIAITVLIISFKNQKKFKSNPEFILFNKLDNFLSETIIQQLGVLRGQIYSVFLKSIFFLILLANLLGLLPFGFTTSSHVIYTFSLAFSIWLGLTILAIFLQGFAFLKLFVPQGAPIGLLFLLTPIEILSYCARCLSLAIRLFANMMSGHTLLNILSGFVIKIIGVGGLLIALAPFGIVMAVVLLEIAIAFLQAYVFLVLICIYLKDSFEVSH